jgi:hypothetical protein
VPCIVSTVVAQPTRQYVITIRVNIHTAYSRVFIQIFTFTHSTVQNLHTDISTSKTRERTVFKELITSYCVRYDPYYCSVDPERLWEIVQRSGGHVHAGPLNILDFYVPTGIITQILLMDAGLSVRTQDSYI